MNTKMLALVGSAAIVLTACSKSGGVVGPVAAKGTPSSATASPSTQIASPYEAPSPTYDNPSASQFHLSLKITSKECFGSAGCNVGYRVQLRYDGDPNNLDPNITYELTYEVLGDENGPQRNSIDTTGSQYQSQTDLASTSSAATKLRIKLISFEQL